jgi:hypothetical protein
MSTLFLRHPWVDSSPSEPPRSERRPDTDDQPGIFLIDARSYQINHEFIHPASAEVLKSSS